MDYEKAAAYTVLTFPWHHPSIVIILPETIGALPRKPCLFLRILSAGGELRPLEPWKCSTVFVRCSRDKPTRRSYSPRNNSLRWRSNAIPV